jgi:hypothetical protein
VALKRLRTGMLEMEIAKDLLLPYLSLPVLGLATVSVAQGVLLTIMNFCTISSV